VKDHERRWQQTDNGRWEATPGPSKTRVYVMSDGAITVSVKRHVLGVGAARWLSLRLAEAAAIAETLAPTETRPQPTYEASNPDPPSSFYEARRRQSDAGGDPE